MITSLLACMLSCSCNPKLQFLRDNALLKDEYALDISDSITGCHSRFFFMFFSVMTEVGFHIEIVRKLNNHCLFPAIGTLRLKCVL